MKKWDGQVRHLSVLGWAVLLSCPVLGRMYWKSYSWAPDPTLSPSLINHMVSVDVKHHYLLCLLKVKNGTLPNLSRLGIEPTVAAFTASIDHHARPSYLRSFLLAGGHTFWEGGREWGGQTDRQTDRQTETQRNRQRHRERDWQRKRSADWQTEIDFIWCCSLLPSRLAAFQSSEILNEWLSLYKARF